MDAVIHCIARSQHQHGCSIAALAQLTGERDAAWLGELEAALAGEDGAIDGVCCEAVTTPAVLAFLTELEVWIAADGEARRARGEPVLISRTTGLGELLEDVGVGSIGERVALLEGGAPELVGRYLTPEGPRPFAVATEAIAVAGGEPAAFEVRETVWGPVVGADAAGRPLAASWIAHHDGGVGLELIGLEEAATIDDAMALANRAGMPIQNFLVADASGRIGWTVAGRLPPRSSRPRETSEGRLAAPLVHALVRGVL